MNAGGICGGLQLYKKACWDDETPEPEQIVVPVPRLEQFQQWVKSSEIVLWWANWGALAHQFNHGARPSPAHYPRHHRWPNPTKYPHLLSWLHPSPQTYLHHWRLVAPHSLPARLCEVDHPGYTLGLQAHFFHLNLSVLKLRFGSGSSFPPVPRWSSVPPVSHRSARSPTPPGSLPGLRNWAVNHLWP